MLRICICALAALPLTLPGQAPTPQQMAALQPGPQHKQLNVLEGNWTVAVRFRYGSGPERQSTATCSARWILGGRYIQLEYKGDSGLEALQFVGYDNQKKKFFEVKFDNMETGVLHTEGTMSADGKVITNIGERTDPMSGKTNRLRTVTTIQDPNHYTVEWYLRQSDGKEEKTVTMVHTRKLSVASAR